MAQLNKKPKLTDVKTSETCDDEVSILNNDTSKSINLSQGYDNSDNEPRLCSLPPPLSPTIRLDDPDTANLYKAMHQKKFDIAIEWLNKWKDKLNQQNLHHIMTQSIDDDAIQLIKYLLDQGLISEQELSECRKQIDNKQNEKKRTDYLDLDLDLEDEAYFEHDSGIYLDPNTGKYIFVSESDSE